MHPIVEKEVSTAWMSPFLPRIAPKLALDSGYSLLELVIALVIIGSLLVIAFPRFWELQVEGERASFEKVFGELHTAVGIDVATFLASGDMAALEALGGSNPMARLAEAPWNYHGTVDGSQLLPAGGWYFDTRERVLIYQVRNTGHFRGGPKSPEQARFGVRLVYVGERPEQRIVGARFVALEPYAWIALGQDQ